MTTLVEQKCIACHGGLPKLTDAEVITLQPQVPDWTVVEREGIKRLERTYKLKDFVHALDFTNRVGILAEEEDHHPVMTVSWGRVTVTWWTHAIKGLHQNDFIMAAKSDALYADANTAR